MGGGTYSIYLLYVWSSNFMHDMADCKDILVALWFKSLIVSQNFHLQDKENLTKKDGILNPLKL